MDAQQQAAAAMMTAARKTKVKFFVEITGADTQEITMAIPHNSDQELYLGMGAVARSMVTQGITTLKNGVPSIHYGPRLIERITFEIPLIQEASGPLPSKITL